MPNPAADTGISYSVETWVFPILGSSYLAIWGFNGTHRLLVNGKGLLLSQFRGNFSSVNALSSGQWHYVVFTYDATKQMASYYIDGQFDSSSAVPASSAAFDSAYYLGQYDTGTFYKWNGRLAQEAFYKGTALSLAQIQAHYAAATTTPTPTPTPSPTPTPYVSAVLADNPQQYFQLNETTGPTAFDSSISDINGTYVGSVTFGAAGPLLSSSSTAITLSGGTASAGVLLPNPAALSGTSYSIETWVFPILGSSYMSIWGFNGTHRLLVTSAGLLLSQLHGNFLSQRALTSGQWHHVVFTYDALAQSASYYIDGTFDSSMTVSNSAAEFNSMYYLGQYDTGTFYKWNGSLAQQAFYKTALSLAQVQSHYTAAGYTVVTPPPPPMPTPTPTPSPTPSPAATPSRTPDSPCDGYRWPMKVATDPGAASIILNNVVDTTIGTQSAIAAPVANNITQRISPVETTVYQLTNVTLIRIQKSIDLDYHLVVQDQKGKTMITESSDPSCAPPGSSALSSQISTARQQIDTAIPNVSTNALDPNETVTLRGVGFWDFAPNFATGQAKNGIEIHPIIDICFGRNCTLP